MFEFVTLAQAGVQLLRSRQQWIPAFAGMTVVSYFSGPEQKYRHCSE
jgi:hypothetical protein